MKLIVIAASFALGLCLPSTLAQNHLKDNESAIRKLEVDLEKAKITGDIVTLDRVITEDYLEVDARGVKTTKADLLKVARAMAAPGRGVSVGPEKTVDDLTIRFRGDTALVSGRLTIRYQFIDYQTSSPQTQNQTPAHIDHERFLRVYLKIAGQWRLIAQHSTFVAK